jgi:hypothetical protein
MALFFCGSWEIWDSAASRYYWHNEGPRPLRARCFSTVYVVTAVGLYHDHDHHHHHRYRYLNAL